MAEFRLIETFLMVLYCDPLSADAFKTANPHSIWLVGVVLARFSRKLMPSNVIKSEPEKQRMKSIEPVPGVAAVMTGSEPVPDFRKTIGLSAEPVAVIKPASGEVKVSVWPAATRNVTPPGPALW